MQNLQTPDTRQHTPNDLAHVGACDITPHMNLKEAASYLQIPTRTLQRLVSSGEIPQGKRGREAYFEQSDLDAYNTKQSQPPAVIVRRVPRLDAPGEALAIAPTQNFALTQFVEQIAQMTQGNVAHRRDVATEHKLSLSLKEASALSGYSTNFLTAQIKAGKLKAARPGQRTRGYNIKREDLEAFIKKL